MIKAKTLADVLKQTNCRISTGNVWLVWDEERFGGCWIVYSTKPYQRNPTREIETTDEDEAARKFLALTGE